MLVANPKFSKLIARSKKSSPQQKQIENGSSNSNKEKSAGEATKFVQFRFEKKPLDGHADLVIHAKMSPLDIIINASSVVHFCMFKSFLYILCFMLTLEFQIRSSARRSP